MKVMFYESDTHSMDHRGHINGHFGLLRKICSLLFFPAIRRSQAYSQSTKLRRTTFTTVAGEAVN